MSLNLPVLFAACAAASFIDIRKRRIPNWLTGGTTVVIAIGSVMGIGPPLVIGFEWALAVGTPLAALAVVRPNAFGMGDAKLAAVLALATGGLCLVGLLIACTSALLYAFLAGKSLDTGLPFAPFLSAGAVASLVIG